eukprot:scaffold22093_cov59-Phaeocystis_antarctica.AAC.4
MSRGSTGLDAGPSWLGAEARGEGYQEDHSHLRNEVPVATGTSLRVLLETACNAVHLEGNNQTGVVAPGEMRMIFCCTCFDHLMCFWVSAPDPQHTLCISRDTCTLRATRTGEPASQASFRVPVRAARGRAPHAHVPAHRELLKQL